MTDSSDVRSVAVKLLARIDTDGSFAHVLVAHHIAGGSLTQRDAALLTEIVFGTTRMRRALDVVLDPLIQRPPPPVGRAACRIGAYQMFFMRIPDYAAINTSVAAAPRRLRPFVNGVLRSVQRAGVPQWDSDAQRLSYPDWIVDVARNELGDDGMRALEAMNSAPLANIGIPISEMSSSGTTRDLRPTVEGRRSGFSIGQSSYAVVEEIGNPEFDGSRLLDLCAAPGGKSLALQELGWTVVSADLAKSRVARLPSRLVAICRGNGLRPPIRSASIDALLVDAPCSGLGVLHRRPDARFRISPSDISLLAKKQSTMLEVGASLLRPGGVLTYSVCTFTRAETVNVAKQFLGTHRHFSAVPISDGWRPYGTGGLNLPQDNDSDGMAVFRFRRDSR